MSWMLVPLFMVTACMYAMVGFGGGSTYIAILAAWGVPYIQIPQISLICNVLVVAGGCIHLFSLGYGDIRRLLPFLLTSIPMAYLGGRIFISKELFMLVLGSVLLTAGFRLLVSQTCKVRRYVSARNIWMWGLPLGALLGLISGMVGIGGGIFLSPLLYFLRWDDAKGISAAASLFILTNSISGLAGQIMKSGVTVSFGDLLPLMMAVVVGGQLGSFFAARKFTAMCVQRCTGILIVIVAARILLKTVSI